eukprot:TRINITY_DN36143_c0_g1_i1.p1 TRINITY_DN36143_c0_g1~~TRINITY_DN36143_c0_g1_i1.p1  ORF type:complete len:836 (-),score=102.97 TRINITY_DN36143_c0_g1_i1:141-2648(-)
MPVPEDWDRPKPAGARAATSFYAPLRNRAPDFDDVKVPSSSASDSGICSSGGGGAVADYLRRATLSNGSCGGGHSGNFQSSYGSNGFGGYSSFPFQPSTSHWNGVHPEASNIFQFGSQSSNVSVGVFDGTSGKQLGGPSAGSDAHLSNGLGAARQDSAPNYSRSVGVFDGTTGQSLQADLAATKPATNGYHPVANVNGTMNGATNGSANSQAAMPSSHDRLMSNGTLSAPARENVNPSMSAVNPEYGRIHSGSSTNVPQSLQQSAPYAENANQKPPSPPARPQSPPRMAQPTTSVQHRWRSPPRPAPAPEPYTSPTPSFPSASSQPVRDRVQSPAPNLATPAAAEVSSTTVSAIEGDDMKVEVRGEGDLPGPWKTWADVKFPERVRQPLTLKGFPKPSPIQMYAWPLLAAGHDLVGVAKTGSGKTLAFLLPAFARLVETRADLRGPPAILVLAPTRELACQIEQEARTFGGMAGMRAVCLYGGASKGPQLAELRQRPQTLVCTPGRLNDLLDPPLGLSIAVDVKSVKYLILDEADRMLDMGFEPQIRKIISKLPEDRQTAMFTATWPPTVRRLASEFQKSPVEVRIGEVENLRVNKDIEQEILFCRDVMDKEDRLGDILRETAPAQAIVFVNQKRMCDVVALRIQGSVCIHGDKDQRERDMALNLFKQGARRVLVATDVAARGLDIKSLPLVINFDPPNRDEDYVHRVGRTGRAGNKGKAVTLLTNEDGREAAFIADMMKRDGIKVPDELARRLASGELRLGGRDRSRGPIGRSATMSRGRSLGPGRGYRDDDNGFDSFPTFGADDFGGPSRPSTGMGRVDRDDRSFCATDCPTW